MQHSNHYRNHHHFPDQRRQCRNRQRPEIVIQPGQVAFRVVCHGSIVGGLIGPAGSIVSAIRRETSCIIHCEDPVQGSEHRVVLVVGSCVPERRISFESGKDGEEEVEKLVSGPQVAVVRVLERMWEVGTKLEGGDNADREGYCGLLANTSHIGAVVGKGGKHVQRMRRESGAQIRILPPPNCAARDDELIQITGGVLAVKKAVFAVTGCLQNCPPYDKDTVLFARSIERASSRDSSDPHSEFFPHLSSLLPPLSGDLTGACSSFIDADGDPGQEKKATQLEVLFRLLCSNSAAGSIIGKRGTIVRALQNETGASIMFASPNCGKRVITISAYENLESWYSPAQNAVIRVFARSIEYDIEQGHSGGSIMDMAVTANLLVASDDVCCLRGKGGRIDTEIIETGADIQVLEGDQVLDGASEDVVLQITGEYKNVQNALFQITSKLRYNLLPGEVLNEVRSPYESMKDISSPRLQQSLSLSLDSNQEISLTRGMTQLGLSNSMDPSPGLQWEQKLGRRAATPTLDGQSNSTTGGGSELERSLQVLLPKEVPNDVGVRSASRGETETTCTEPQHSSLDLSSDCIEEASLTKENYLLGFSNEVGSSSPESQLSQALGRDNTVATTDCKRGSTNFGGSVHVERKKSAVVANTTVELIVSEDILDSIYGEDGSNLDRLRQISGAKVDVRNPSPGKSEGMVIISGKPDQTSAAQSLLQAFM